MSQEAIELTKALINCASVTPNDAGCQALLIGRLQQAGFTITELPFADTKNLWATHGSGQPLILFQGHTDVVPPGSLDDWKTNPFSATERDGKLFGRGASDMKSGLAAMAQAAINFCLENPDHVGTVAFAATSDEEGPATNGMLRVVEWLQQQNIQVDYCITGEPTSANTVGDTLKVGRRGSLHAQITFQGKQGHIAYPHLALNPIHLAAAAIQALCDTQWDEGHGPFQPTSLQFYDIQSGTGAGNVIPGTLTAKCNFRYAPCHTAESLKQQFHTILDQHCAVEYCVDWQLSAEPFLTEDGKLVNTMQTAIKSVTGSKPEINTSGGTSDSRFFAKLGCEIVDFGPINATAHQVNENIDLSEISHCYEIYFRTLQSILLGPLTGI